MSLTKVEHEFSVGFIEDDTDVRRELVRLFRLHGVSKCRTLEPDDVLAKIRRGGRSGRSLPPYVLVDIMLDEDRPELGLDIVEEAKQANPKRCLIVVTNYAEWHRRKALRVGADTVLSKHHDLEITARMAYNFIVEHHRYHQAIEGIGHVAKATGNANALAYYILMQDQEWVKRMNGSFVAIANGEVLWADQTKEGLLSYLDEHARDAGVFISQVGHGADGVELPSVLEFQSK